MELGERTSTLGDLKSVKALDDYTVEFFFEPDALGTFAAFALFVVVFYLAQYLLRLNAVKNPVQKLAALSYCVFLVQHVGIVWAQAAFIKVFDKMHWIFTQWNVTVLLTCTILAIMIAAWILKLVSDWTTKRVSKFLS